MPKALVGQLDELALEQRRNEEETGRGVNQAYDNSREKQPPEKCVAPGLFHRSPCVRSTCVRTCAAVATAAREKLLAH